VVRFLMFLVFLANPIIVRAQSTQISIPAVTPLNFSQIAGKYDISSSAAPTQVHVEEPITLTVRITGKGPAGYRPERKDLKIFPDDLADAFYAEAAPDQDKHLPEKGLWEFVYRLRPKGDDVTSIPGLQLKYFDLDTKQFASSYADEIPITVKGRPPASAESLRLRIVRAPSRFYQLRPADEVLRDDTPMRLPDPGLLVALLALPPLLCFMWYRAWRRLYPSAAERRQMRRSRAARLALAYLQKQAPDVPGTRAATVDFLRQRLDLAALEATPKEVADHLKRLGIAKSLVIEWTAFLNTCDRYRFAPMTSQHESPLSVHAIRLIHALEADPCVAR
jgi:hypothetical protein